MAPTESDLVCPSHRHLPPPLPPRRSIPLPPLSDDVIMIHPLLAGYPPSAPPRITYDLSFPPITATVYQPTFASRPRSEDWRTHPAMGPGAACSITIRVPRIERPVVVLPGTLDQRWPTIGDVLDAIYAAVRLECLIELESCGLVGAGAYSINRLPGGNPIWRGGSYSSEMDGLLVTSIRRRLGGASVWMGLSPSEQEGDVWVLQTGGLARF